MNCGKDGKAPNKKNRSMGGSGTDVTPFIPGAENNTEAIAAWAKAHYLPQLKKLPKKHHRCLQEYKGDFYYDVNRMLREQRYFGPDAALNKYEVSQAMARCATPCDLLVFRGGKRGNMEPLGNGLLRDRAFVSTSLRSSVAADFIDSALQMQDEESRQPAPGTADEVVYYEIEVPEGTRAIYLDYNQDEQGKPSMSDYPGEAELLLDCEYHYRQLSEESITIAGRQVSKIRLQLVRDGAA